MIALSCTAVLCVGIAGVMWRSGDHSAFVVSKYVALFGVTMVVVVVMGAYTDFGPIRRASTVELGSVDGKAATIVPGSAGYFVLYQLIWVCFAVMFLAAGAETAAAAWRTHWPLALLFTCLGLGSASAPVLALVGKLRRGQIALTSDEIIYDGWSSRTRLPWADVSRVITAFEQRPLLVITGSNGARWSHRATTPVVPLGSGQRQIWRLDRPAGNGSIVLECPRLAVDGNRLYRFLTYYVDNPEARVELGTSQSLNRWRTVL